MFKSSRILYIRGQVSDKTDSIYTISITDSIYTISIDEFNECDTYNSVGHLIIHDERYYNDKSFDIGDNVRIVLKIRDRWCDKLYNKKDGLNFNIFNVDNIDNNYIITIGHKDIKLNISYILKYPNKSSDKDLLDRFENELDLCIIHESLFLDNTIISDEDLEKLNVNIDKDEEKIDLSKINFDLFNKKDYGIEEKCKIEIYKESDFDNKKKYEIFKDI